jgi:CRP/FNR family transcriptional regulator, cyclic AMP receptor protein
MTLANPDLLRSHPLLRRLSDEQLGRVAQAGDLELYRPAEEIVLAGTLGDSLYLILSGSATVHAGAGGKLLARLLAGEFFGEMSLIEPALRSATVRAAELSELFRVPHVSLANLLKDDPPAMNLILVSIVRTLSHRLRHTNELIGDVAKLSEFLASALV